MKKTYRGKIRDEDINALIKKSEFVIITSELTGDIHNDKFEEAKDKIANLKELLNEIEELIIK